MTTLDERHEDERHEDGARDGDPVSLRRAWHQLSQGGTLPLVVRSSSPQEHTQESSLAGQFASVLEVRGWRDFRTAIRTVLESAHRPDGTTAPMAVLVQPMPAARVGGVLFGADPVEGRTDRMLVSAVRGGPDTLVSGEQPGTNYWLSRWGRVLRTEPPDHGDGGAAPARAQSRGRAAVHRADLLRAEPRPGPRGPAAVPGGRRESPDGRPTTHVVPAVAPASPYVRAAVRIHIEVSHQLRATIREVGERGTQVVHDRRKSASPAFAPWMNAVISPGV